MKDKEHGNQIEKTKGNVCQVQTFWHIHMTITATDILGTLVTKATMVMLVTKAVINVRRSSSEVSYFCLVLNNLEFSQQISVPLPPHCKISQNLSIQTWPN